MTIPRTSPLIGTPVFFRGTSDFPPSFIVPLIWFVCDNKFINLINPYHNIIFKKNFGGGVYRRN